MSYGRPFFVNIIMIIFVIQGIIALAILGLVSSLFAGAPPYVMLQLSALLGILYAIAITVALVNFAMAYLAYRGKSWGRWVIVGLTILTLIGSVLNISDYSQYTGVFPLAETLVGLAVAMTIMAIVVLYGMFRKDVRDYFSSSKVSV